MKDIVQMFQQPQHNKTFHLQLRKTFINISVKLTYVQKHTVNFSEDKNLENQTSWSFPANEH